VLFDGVPLIGTYRIRGSAQTPQQAAVAAVARCRPGAVMSGPVVLGGLGIEGFSWSSPVIVRVHADRIVQPLPFLVVRDPFLDQDRALLENVDASNATRAIVDTALTITGKQLITGIDSAKWKRLTSNPCLEACAAPLAAAGHVGGIVIRELLGSANLDKESHGERAMAPVLDRLPVPVRYQVWISQSIRVDAAVDGVPLAVEYLGAKDHSSATRQAEDAERHDRIRQLGWHVIYVVKDDLKLPDALLARVSGVREGLLGAGITRV
jgi:very-short-patch-repair endonuclease